MLEEMLDKLNGIKVLRTPVGMALGFIGAISVMQVIKSVVEKFLPVAAKWPILTMGAAAIGVSAKPVRKLIGDTGATLLSLSALIIGAEQQVATMTGKTISAHIAGAATNLLAKANLATPATTPAALSGRGRVPALALGAPAGEVGVGTRKAYTDLATAMRLNMMA